MPVRAGEPLADEAGIARTCRRREAEIAAFLHHNAARQPRHLPDHQLPPLESRAWETRRGYLQEAQRTGRPRPVPCDPCPESLTCFGLFARYFPSRIGALAPPHRSLSRGAFSIKA